MMGILGCDPLDDVRGVLALDAPEVVADAWFAPRRTVPAHVHEQSRDPVLGQSQPRGEEETADDVVFAVGVHAYGDREGPVPRREHVVRPEDCAVYGYQRLMAVRCHDAPFLGRSP